MRNQDRPPKAARIAIALLAALLLAGFASPAPASAQSLKELRAQGIVGEAYDGYVRGRTDRGKAAAVALNAKRRAIYAKRAGEQGTTPEQVGRVYANQIISGAPGGTWFLQETGNWVQK